MTARDFPDDLELVSRLLLGDERAFEQIVRKHQIKIRAFCRHMLQDQALAEDAAQEVFVRAWQSIKKFTPRPSLSAWLCRIARNHCIDLLRRRPTGETFDLESVRTRMHGPTGGAAGLFAASPAESRDFLAKLMKSLPEDYREVILLKEMYGLSYEEMAESLECTVDSVKGRLKRARAKAADNLRHFLGAANVVIEKEERNE